MNSLKTRIEQKRDALTSPQGWFKNEDGAIDLASIMVGIIVIGLIGGVIASTVFVVIPWTQDNAARQQLDSVVSAESAYFGLSADNPPALPAGTKTNSFGNSAELAAAKLMSTSPNYCVTTPNDGKSYTAYSKSASGEVFYVTDKNSKPELFAGPLPDPLPADCQFLEGMKEVVVPSPDPSSTATPAPTPAPNPTPSPTTTIPPVAEYVDPTPTLTALTYQCDTAVSSGAIPLRGTVNGTETWSDGLTRNVAASNSPSRSFLAGVTYTVTFEGNYNEFRRDTSTASMNLSKCLRSVDHLGSETGVTNMEQAFSNTPNLTSVPEHIPSTVTNLQYSFWSSPKFNDPNVGKWDVSNVTNTAYMFYNSTSFNQPLNDWNTVNLASTASMFAGATSFNQPLDKWDTSKFRNPANMFNNATSFNQPLNDWDTSNFYVITGMFSGATSFNQPLDKWDVSEVGDMSKMFYLNSTFNQNLSTWDTARVTKGSDFAPKAFPTEYLPLRTTRSTT